MKTKIFLFILIIPLSLFSQEIPNYVKSFKKEFDNQKRVDSILNIVNKLASEKTSEKIGEFKMLKKNIKIYPLTKDTVKWKVLREEINIEEGFITDILVVLINEEKTKRYFTNTSPISLPRFFHYDKWKLKEEGKRENYILLMDVLRYEASRNNNFVPDNQKFQLKAKVKDKETKSVLLTNNLNSLLNFRIYTDFLGLINEESNGIVNFEAFSKIFLAPNNVGLVHFFKDVKPYLNYSRFDNNDRSISLKNDTIEKRLSLKQKAYITTGVKFNALEFKLAKEYPFSLSIPLKFELNIVESDSISITKKASVLRTITYGTGLSANFKRINNFGLNLSIDIDLFKYLKSNSIFLKNNQAYFTTLGTSAELYYYESKNSAFFLRFNSRRLISKGNENYATIQFGYKTALSFSKK